MGQASQAASSVCFSAELAVCAHPGLENSVGPADETCQLDRHSFTGFSCAGATATVPHFPTPLSTMILRDPVHGLISFESEEEEIVVALLATPEVQRLRRIRQLGLTSMAYPGADHTRFSHAVGAAHVMTRLLKRLRDLHEELPYWQRVTTERAREALAASLLHDIGHGPFSHLFEEAIPRGPKHEKWSQDIIMNPDGAVHRVLTRFDPTLPVRVAQLVRGQHELPYLARAVSGTLDVDRCDYLLRDAHATGVAYGLFDLDWLLRSLRFGNPASADAPPPLAVDGAKGIPAIESFILGRLFMFQQVYFHKTSRSCEWLFVKIIERVRSLLREGIPLADTPLAIRELLSGNSTPLDHYLSLDDAVLWVALAAWAQSKDPILADLASRLRSRRLFKTYELHEEQAHPAAQQRLLEAARAIASEAQLDPAYYVGLDAPSDIPFDDRNDALSVLFPNGSSRKPGDVSFLLSRLRGERMERTRLIFPPELRERLLPVLANG